MPVTLLDLPDEVITYIVECLPQRIVVELLDVPELRHYALQLLYQTIVITKTKREYDPVEAARSFTGDYEFRRRHLTPFIDYDQFVAMINDESASFVKNITFKDPYALLRLHEAYPESLEHVNITFSFWRFHEYRIDLDIKLFLDQFMKLPYNIVAIDQFGGFVEQLSGRRRTKLDSPEQEVLRIKQLERFENLTSLELESNILDTSLGDIPRTLKHLKCDILMSQDPNTFKLDFPAGLESLHTNCKAAPGGPTRGYTDLTHLQNLKKFTTYQGTRFKLPRNLREFDAPRIPDMVKLIRECPHLTALKCSDEDVQRERLDDPLNLPRELKVLEMRDQFYFNLQIFRLTQLRAVRTPETAEDTEAMRFPQSLEKLVIRYMRSVGDHSSDWFKMFSNNDELRLDCLTELELYDMGGFQNLGPLPRSLRTIKFHNTAGINPDDFKNLTHLTSLSITSMDGRSFVCQLPPSLLQLEMRENFFTTVQLEAENLRYLKLRGNCFRTLTSSVLKVPASVKDFDLSDNEITVIDRSFQFPSGLRYLSLSNNELLGEQRNSSWLEWVPLLGSFLGKNQTEEDLPSSVKVVDLRDTELPEDFKFSALRLSHCRELKELDFSYNTPPQPVDEATGSSKLRETFFIY